MFLLGDLFSYNLVDQDWSSTSRCFVSDQQAHSIDPSSFPPDLATGFYPNTEADFGGTLPTWTMPQSSSQNIHCNDLVQSTSEDAGNMDCCNSIELLAGCDYNQHMQLEASAINAEDAVNLQQHLQYQPQPLPAFEMLDENFHDNPQIATYGFADPMVAPPQALADCHVSYAFNQPNAMNLLPMDPYVSGSNSFNQLFGTSTPTTSGITWPGEDVSFPDASLNPEFTSRPPSAMPASGVFQQGPSCSEGHSTQDISTGCRVHYTGRILPNHEAPPPGKATETVAVIETPQNSALPDSHPITLVENDRMKKLFGPSKLVSLPKRRTGGRKGPLTAQTRRDRKETRNQGVCMWCRKKKEKVMQNLEFDQSCDKC